MCILPGLRFVQVPNGIHLDTICLVVCVGDVHPRIFDVPIRLLIALENVILSPKVFLFAVIDDLLDLFRGVPLGNEIPFLERTIFLSMLLHFQTRALSLAAGLSACVSRSHRRTCPT